MESQYTVEVGGERFAVPRDVEHQGGAAVQSHLDAQPGYAEAVARDRADYQARHPAAAVQTSATEGSA